MSNTGFFLIVKLDTLERLENTLAVSKYLATHFNANIYLWEVSSYHNGVLAFTITKGVVVEKGAKLKIINSPVQY